MDAVTVLSSWFGAAHLHDGTRGPRGAIDSATRRRRHTSPSSTAPAKPYATSIRSGDTSALARSRPHGLRCDRDDATTSAEVAGVGDAFHSAPDCALPGGGLTSMQSRSRSSATSSPARVDRHRWTRHQKWRQLSPHRSESDRDLRGDFGEQLARNFNRQRLVATLTSPRAAAAPAAGGHRTLA
jgi:hypothetical protein